SVFLLTTLRSLSFFFFNVTPPSVIYTLSLHDALPISSERSSVLRGLSPLAVLRPRTSRIAGVRQIAAPTAPSDPEHGSSTGAVAHGAPADMAPSWRFVRRSTSADARTRSGLVEPRSPVCQ